MEYEEEYGWGIVCDEIIKQLKRNHPEPSGPGYSYFVLCIDHYKARFLLCRSELYRPAHSLLRPLVEAFLRGWWLEKQATEIQVARALKKHRFPSLVELGTLLQDQGNLQEDFLSKNVRDLLHDFTHGGHWQRKGDTFTKERSFFLRVLAVQMSLCAMFLLTDCYGRHDFADLVEKSFFKIMPGEYHLE